ncbi:MAG: ADP-ribose pyrophosphatase [Tenericutes bacterium HGW-Tenericutes-3]|nr:MAG: ADP-ribose pyrophosphatase [Tenericutes bacterium HGW-Tenericutes-3]
MKETKKTSKKVYECSFMELYEDEVILDNQKESQRVYIKHPGAAAILPITKDQRIILIKQFRYPIQMINLEVPAGKKDDINEDSLECAHRELEEETGYITKHMEFYKRIYPCVGYSDEYIDLFIARDCEKVDHPKAMDTDENIECFFYQPNEIKDLIESDQIGDSKTLILLQHYLLKG